MYTKLKVGACFTAVPIIITSLYSLEPEVVYELDEYTVSAGPLPRLIDDFSTPATILDEDAIKRQNASSLGALLDGQPGVTATSFGAGASRPIIRGFDGPRVEILNSGVRTIDVSATSPDHAVVTEPLLVERIEVLRGPSTLLYGSSAIGGVVNVVGREIKRERLPDGTAVEGTVETRYDSVSDGWTNLGYATAGTGNWALSVTGLTRDSNDYEIPGPAERYGEEDHGHEEHHDEDHDEHEEDHDEDHHEEEHDEHEEEHDENGGQLENSFVETDAFSVGGTWFFGENNYIGLAYSDFSSLYGLPGHAHAHEEEEGHEEEHEEEDHDEEEEEETVFIDLKSERYDVELGVFDPTDWIAAARLRFSYTDYTHTELEGLETGTVFDNEGWELRGEIAHQPLWIFDEGVFGAQLTDTDFSAIGEEAFTPPATTRNQAFFITEKIDLQPISLGIGGRLENQTSSAEGFTKDYSDVALSLATDVIWRLSDQQTLSLNLQRSQRHPTSTELYANGPHLATSQFEVGDPDLELETAYGIDFGYRYKAESWEAQLSIFYTHFEDYIFAEETGAEADELPVFEFVATDADFWGFEFELEYSLFKSVDSELSLLLMSDYIRATDQDTDESLPRIPPLRVGGGLRFSYMDWDTGLLLRHAFKQDRVAPEETTTPNYTELNLDVAKKFYLKNGRSFTVFAAATNLLDEEIRQHTSVLKDITLLPGRNLMVGARFEF